MIKKEGKDPMKSDQDEGGSKEVAKEKNGKFTK